MIYLLIIFCSPIYLLIRKKWGAFILNAILYMLIWPGLLLFVPGIVFWALAVGHASWHLRKEHMEEQATLIATKMAEQMQKDQQSRN